MILIYYHELAKEKLGGGRFLMGERGFIVDKREIRWRSRRL
jgi:hypothetical protein